VKEEEGEKEKEEKGRQKGRGTRDEGRGKVSRFVLARAETQKFPHNVTGSLFC